MRRRRRRRCDRVRRRWDIRGGLPLADDHDRRDHRCSGPGRDSEWAVGQADPAHQQWQRQSAGSDVLGRPRAGVWGDGWRSRHRRVRADPELRRSRRRVQHVLGQLLGQLGQWRCHREPRRRHVDRPRLAVRRQPCCGERRRHLEPRYGHHRQLHVRPQRRRRDRRVDLHRGPIGQYHHHQLNPAWRRASGRQLERHDHALEQHRQRHRRRHCVRRNGHR